MEKHSLFFLFLTLSFLISSVLVINQVNATTTYEWIQNGGFDNGFDVNYIQNNGFETGDLTNWVKYGSGSVTTSGYNSVYCFGLGGDVSYYINQTLVTVIDSDTLTKAGFYAKSSFSNLSVLYMRFYYNDSTTSDSSRQFALAVGNWEYFNCTADITPNKFLSKIAIRYSSWQNGANNFIDDVFVGIEHNSDGQTTITTTSFPWYTFFGTGLIYPDINSDTSYSSPNSVLFEIGNQHYATCWQDINYLDSNTVTSLTCYGLDASGGGGGILEMRIRYSDNSFSGGAIALTGSWALYNFTNYVLPNRIITAIYITATAYSGSYIYIDSVSLLSTDQTSDFAFLWSLSPPAISTTIRTTNTFIAYQNTYYRFYGSIYNNSVNEGSGFYSVSSNIGSLSGIISLGHFDFVIAERVSLANYTSEDFVINIISDVKNFTVVITGYWVSLTVSPPITPPDVVAEEKTNQFINAFPIMLIMALFIIPATFYLGVGGFVGGFSVGAIVCVWTGLAPTWFIAVIVLTDIVMIFFATKQNNSAPSG